MKTKDTIKSSKMESFEVATNSLSLLKFESWSSYGLIIGLSLSLAIGFILKSLVINYVLFHAPKDRPLNRLILLDQVLNVTQTKIIQDA